MVLYLILIVHVRRILLSCLESVLMASCKGGARRAGRERRHGVATAADLISAAPRRSDVFHLDLLILFLSNGVLTVPSAAASSSSPASRESVMPPAAFHSRDRPFSLALVASHPI
jgi:hypothetical protein